jgi:glucose/arabinose dehydrogenase
MVNGRPGGQVDLVKGWLDDATQKFWGRPVDVVPDVRGSLIISDDFSGTLYRLKLAK